MMALHAQQFPVRRWLKINGQTKRGSEILVVWTRVRREAIWYGFINTCLQSLVTEKFGEETWEKLKASAEVQDAFMTYTVYDDSITIKLIQEACKVLDVSMEAILKLFGEYFFKFCKVSGYDRMLRTLGGNLTEFIENLDALHSYLALSYQEMNAPSFRVEGGVDGAMLLHYYSDRNGLCHIVPGIIEAVAKDFFDTDVAMSILDMNEEVERTGKKEHVVFLVVQKARRQTRTAKANRSQDGEDIDTEQEALKTRLLRKKEKVLNSAVCPGEKPHWDVRASVMSGNGKPLVWAQSQEVPVKRKLGTDILGTVNFASLLDPGLPNWSVFLDWKSVANHSQPAVRRTKGKNQESPCLSLSLRSYDVGQCCPAFHSQGEGGPLGDTFQPVYPERLWVEEEVFCSVFPFHLVFDEALRVKQAGVNIQKYVPGLLTQKFGIDEYFSIIHPQVTFSISSICKFINSQFVLKTRREMMPKVWKSQPALKLRGQMIWMDSLRCMIFMCSPKLRSLQELEESKMHLSDIAPHDTTRDLILLNQQRLAEMELSRQLEKKKEELRVLSKHLAIEKKKTETLLYAMLPEHVANQLKEGKKVAAGEFETCTILFSDVVTFTNICAACEPIQIVNMLNTMYSKFDRLTSVHEVYKVETIGDAYMVVGGVPVPVESHAQRVANFALGMRISAEEVMNPVTGEPIQIRVGIHTGPVLAGVVGDKMPRYCLFGDTVNTASRMESHGLPNKVHLSPTAYRALENKGFEIVKRGEIEVKGKGKMTTYFLVQNLNATEDEIMGRPTVVTNQKVSDEVTPAGSPVAEPDSTDAAKGQPPPDQTKTSSPASGPEPSVFCVVL
ncbi:Guanylate cyclase soluble subunit beta-2 [Microtus ochrogaster]|uniref:guanylate cyclase n=1 Tax=Microtus ochrogaster TaxID=79684 RepID=A0A8J6L1C0_MICOH|nr:Guanylate cyclase soluble subunit beta-2 [Microtus ochrogaster]